MNIKKLSPTLFAESKKSNGKIKAFLSYNFMPKEVFFDRFGIKRIAHFPFIKTFAVELNRRSISYISDHSEIYYINSIVQCEIMMNIVKETLGFNLLNSYGLDGNGQIIAVLDSGISPHFDLMYPTKRILHFEDILYNKEKMYDDNGHGTMICGVVAGNGIYSAGKYGGVAPNAKIVSVKCMNSDGAGSSIDILKGMQWIYDNKERFNISVVSMAFGASFLGLYDPLVQGANVLIKKGIAVVAAAGNDANGGIKSPGVSPKVITVGSYDDKRTIERGDDTVAEFSSVGPSIYGKKPNFLFPGVNIVAPSLSGYSVFSGTSVSTGIATGVVALIKQRYGNISPDEIKEILSKNAVKRTFNPNIEGDGFVYF